MAKESKYGEETKMLSFRVPLSLTSEVTQIVKLRLLEAEKSNVMNGDTANIKFVKTTESSYDGDKTNRFDLDESIMVPKVTKEQWDSVVPKKIEPQVVDDVKKDKVKALQEMADFIKSGGGAKSELFTAKKKPIDQEYDCVMVTRGIPDASERIYYGSNNRIAFWDRDDNTVFYVNWEGKYYRFVNSAEFNRFLKDNNIK